MTLSKETLSVLKKFSDIHQSIKIKAGNEIIIKSADKSTYATCIIKEQFPREFNCFDLREFIQAVELIDKPVLLFDDDGKVVYIKNETNTINIKYTDSDPDWIKSFPEKKLNMPPVEINLTVTQDQLKSIMKAASVLSTEFIGFKSDGDKVKLIAFNKNNGDQTETNSFSIDLGKCDKGIEYLCFLESSSLNKLMEGTYDVSIATKKINDMDIKIIKFSHRDIKLDIYQILDTNSKIQ